MKAAIALCLIAGLFIFACQPSARFRSEDRQQLPAKTTGQKLSPASDLDHFVESWMYTPYRYGGMSKSGVDCSGFSSLTMRHVYGVEIPRTASAQYNEGQKVKIPALIPGDLVFFQNIRGSGIDHVGVYLGQNRFAHATENSGVTISGLQETYYQDRFVGACRFQK